MPRTAIRLTAVGRTYGTVEALRDVDLELSAGSCTALVGHNGSGKSTLLQIVAGRVRPTAGDVEVLGARVTTVAGRREVRSTVAVGGAVAAFYPDLTVEEHLRLVAAAHGVEAPDDLVGEVLERYRLTDRAEALPGQLSTGMRQKLDLALTVVRPWQVLLLDEPARGLDPAARRRLWEDVAEFRGLDRTVVIATHLVGELTSLVDRAVLLEGGSVVADGTLDEVTRSAAAARLGIAP